MRHGSTFNDTMVHFKRAENLQVIANFEMVTNFH